MILPHVGYDLFTTRLVAVRVAFGYVCCVTLWTLHRFTLRLVAFAVDLRTFTVAVVLIDCVTRLFVVTLYTRDRHVPGCVDCSAAIYLRLIPVDYVDYVDLRCYVTGGVRYIAIRSGD